MTSVMAPKKQQPRRSKRLYDLSPLLTEAAELRRLAGVIEETLQDAEKAKVKQLFFEGQGVTRALESLRSFRKGLQDAVDDARLGRTPSE